MIVFLNPVASEHTKHSRESIKTLREDERSGRCFARSSLVLWNGVEISAGLSNQGKIMGTQFHQYR